MPHCTGWSAPGTGLWEMVTAWSSFCAAQESRSGKCAWGRRKRHRVKGWLGGEYKRSALGTYKENKAYGVGVRSRMQP